MEIYVGTSGWLYDWNEGASLDWYVEESGLNSVELNASFYRFPYRSQVTSWVKRGWALKWSIKVHRSITHFRKLRPEALDTWFRFHDLFKPMESVIDFYLFQMPPSFNCSSENLARITRFHEASNTGLKMAVEFRNKSCFNERIIEWCRENGIVVVSVDSPIASWIVECNRIVYLRMHGRTAWYAHDYSVEELREVASRITELNPEKAYVFFNNNHWMLANARIMKSLLESMEGSST